MPRGGKVTPIQPSLVARLSGAVKGAIRGASDAWFGPGEPLQTIAPEAVRGRLWDYPVAFNLHTQPRGEAGENGIGFADLRALADPTLGGLDLLRIAIEKRKNQMESQQWIIRGRDGSDGGEKARGIEEALRFPDGVFTFAQWMRMLIEDLLVLDAPTLYLAPSTEGHLVPQVMDGALLKPLLQVDGRTPLPPDPAYQQNLKGVPAVDYTLDEIVRMPRNLRSNRVYGMSPVEQVQMTVSIALRRQLSQLETYTAGSIPDAIAKAPDSWNLDQVKAFQEYWDTVMSGNTAELKRLRFVPGGTDITLLKQGVLKDEFDEWVSRIICFCFDLSPQALVKEMNRATAQTSKDTAQEQGLEPLKLWWKDLIDVVLIKAFDAAELELWFKDEEIGDPEVKAKVFVALVGKPMLTQDEGRAAFGYDKLTPAQQAELNPPPPVLPAGPGADEQAAAEADAEAKVAAIQKRAAEPVLALAGSVTEIAKALRERPAPAKRKLRFVTDEKTGTTTGAVEE